MIVLIVGDFGVGKDLAADMLIEYALTQQDCVKFEKILSYTTRKPRYDGEDTHLFCTEEDYKKFSSNELLASTKIDNNYYFTLKKQFDKDKVNVYVVDDAGVKDVVESGFDRYMIIKIVRPAWLIEADKARLNRERQSEPYDYKWDYRVMNDNGKEALRSYMTTLYNLIIREVRQLYTVQSLVE